MLSKADCVRFPWLAEMEAQELGHPFNHPDALFPLTLHGVEVWPDYSPVIYLWGNIVKEEGYTSLADYRKMDVSLFHGQL